MTIAYELAVLGDPLPSQVQAVESAMRDILSHFGLQLGREVSWVVKPATFRPSQKRTAAALFFAATGTELGAARGLSEIGIPVVPVVSHLSQTSVELPVELRRLNALAYGDAGPRGVATAALECAGLLPRQKRVFLSYRRSEATSVALQLFDALSARRYDVFLDTHRVLAGDDFQEIVWHRLCESDLLIMLHTRTYFEHRWTSAEFGRALATGISVLRVGWPGVPHSERTATASAVDLGAGDLFGSPETLSSAALDLIAGHVEIVRSASIAVRRRNLMSKLAYGIQTIGGKVIGLGMGAGYYLQLADGRVVVAYPTVGVPSALTLYEARLSTHSDDVAVVYDPVGVSKNWLEHLDWLGQHIDVPRWVKVNKAAWDFADWQMPI